MKVKIQ